VSAWQRFVSFLDAREDPISLALVRIVCCTTIAVHLSRFVFSGAAEFALLPRARGGMSSELGWLELFGGAEPWSIHLLTGACIVFAVCSALGVFTRPMLALTWLGFRAVSSLNAETKGSYDGLFVDILFVLMLSGAGRALSVDAIWRKQTEPAARWPRLLLVAQIGIMYFGSALNKASVGWVPGGDASALWYILQQPTWARTTSLPLWSYPITQVATTSAWLFEVTGPIFVLAILLRESAPRGRAMGAVKRLFDRARVLEIYLAFGIAMHIGIELLMEVGPFCFATLALYPAAVAPERWRALFMRVKKPRVDREGAVA
jgi:hypothetical protein